MQLLYDLPTLPEITAPKQDKVTYLRQIVDILRKLDVPQFTQVKDSYECLLRPFFLETIRNEHSYEYIRAACGEDILLLEYFEKILIELSKEQIINQQRVQIQKLQKQLYIRKPGQEKNKYLLPENEYKNISCLEFTITRKCNYRCEYCIAQAGPEQEHTRDQTVDSFMQILPKIKKNSFVQLVGGEPTIHPRFMEMAKTVIAYGHRLSIVTNFSLPNSYFETLIDIVDTQQLKIEISLHLSQIKSVEEFLQKVIAIKKYAGAKTEIFVASVLTEENYETLKDVQKMFLAQGVNIWLQHVKIGNVFVKYPPHIVEYLKNARPKKSNKAFEMESLKSSYGSICKAGLSFMRICLNGDIQRCFVPPDTPSKFFALGNINTQVNLLKKPLPCLSPRCTCHLITTQNLVNYKKRNICWANQLAVRQQNTKKIILKIFGLQGIKFLLYFFWRTIFTPIYLHNFFCFIYNWPDNAWPLLKEMVNTKVTLIKNRKFKQRPDKIMVVSVIRNDLLRAKKFLTHYRNLGIQQFAFLDDQSTDGTREFLLTQKDVELFISPQRYTSIRRVAWSNYILNYYGRDRWYLVLDSDELLVYDQCERRNIYWLLSYLEQKKITACTAMMLDMYARTNTPQHIDELKFFDNTGYRRTSETHFPRWTGGVRQRVLGMEMCLSKTPLFFYDQKTIYTQSHFIFPFAKNFECIHYIMLLHYKFMKEDIVRYQERIDENSMDSKSLRQYRIYIKNIWKNNSQKDKGLLYVPNISMEYKDSQSLVKLDFLKTLEK